MAYLDELDIEAVLLIDRLLTIRMLENNKKLLEENLTGTIPFPKPKGETKMMSEENKAADMAATARLVELNERCREKLRRAEGIACYALSHQPDSACLQDINRYLTNALTDIVDAITAKMTIPPVVSDAGNPPAESAEVAENAEPKKKKAVGNFAGAGKVVSYAIGRDMTVTVTANAAGQGAWSFKGIKDGETMIIGSIFGGKRMAMQYCRFLRNGIVSRAKKVWKNHHRENKGEDSPAETQSRREEEDASPQPLNTSTSQPLNISTENT